MDAHEIQNACSVAKVCAGTILSFPRSFGCIIRLRRNPKNRDRLRNRASSFMDNNQGRGRLLSYQLSMTLKIFFILYWFEVKNRTLPTTRGYFLVCIFLI